jgi:hypothetical protein
MTLHACSNHYTLGKWHCLTRMARWPFHIRGILEARRSKFTWPDPRTHKMILGLDENARRCLSKLVAGHGGFSIAHSAAQRSWIVPCGLRASPGRTLTCMVRRGSHIIGFVIESSSSGDKGGPCRRIMASRTVNSTHQRRDTFSGSTQTIKHARRHACCRRRSLSCSRSSGLSLRMSRCGRTLPSGRQHASAAIAHSNRG